MAWEHNSFIEGDSHATSNRQEESCDSCRVSNVMNTRREFNNKERSSDPSILFQFISSL